MTILGRFGARHKVGRTLQAALDRLAIHYGIATSGPERGRGGVWQDRDASAAYPRAGRRRHRS
jgi:hypothetical protein